jgi:hypothetical protein
MHKSRRVPAAVTVPAVPQIPQPAQRPGVVRVVAIGDAGSAIALLKVR